MLKSKTTQKTIPFSSFPQKSITITNRIWTHHMKLQTMYFPKSISAGWQKSSTFALYIYSRYIYYLNCIQTLHPLWSIFYKCSGLDNTSWLSNYDSSFCASLDAFLLSLASASTDVKDLEKSLEKLLSRHSHHTTSKRRDYTVWSLRGSLNKNLINKTFKRIY